MNRQAETGTSVALARASRKVSPGVELAAAVEPDRASGTAYVFPVEPSRISDREFRQLLLSCVMSGASDVTIQSDQQPRAEIHGILYRAMRRPLAGSEVIMLLSETYGGANALAEINALRALDYSYEVNLHDGSRQRFRVNATGIFGRDGSGVELTFRALPAKTPDLAMVKIDEHEIEALMPRDGIVVIGGATGSGKSTTMAAVTRHHLETSIHPVKIVDVQAPIEYTFRDVTSAHEGSASLIGQSEVGKHIKSFADGVHSALRRKPHIINVGEARDFETISASLEASLTGHLVYTTTHAGSVSNAIRRLLTIFPGAERESRALDLISALRFLMIQHLVPRCDIVGRVPVREYLRFTDRIRDRLIEAPISSWPTIINAEVADRNPDRDPQDLRLSLQESCAFYYRKGWISREDAKRVGGPKAIVDDGDE